MYSKIIINVPFCQTGVDGGFESTSHLRDTEILSLIGIPNPGILLIPKEGVSRNTKIQLKKIVEYKNMRDYCQK